MKFTDKQKTLGLMVLSMLFGGGLVHFMGSGGQPSKNIPKVASSVENMGSMSQVTSTTMPAGHPNVADMSAKSKMASAPKLTPAGSIDDLVVGLRNRLEANPADVKGWVLLAKSYQHMGQWPAAQNAASKARELGYDGEILTASEGAVNPHTSVPGRSKDYVSDFFAKDNGADQPASK